MWILMLSQLAHAQSCTDTPGAGLHLMTYNTQFKPDRFSPQYPLEPKTRARAIANRILALDPDIIALQEVFLDDARNELVHVLGGAYPWYVSEIDAHWYEMQDSGLMLFSRFPIVAPTCNDFAGDAGSVSSSPQVSPEWVSLIDYQEWGIDYLFDGCPGDEALCDAFKAGGYFPTLAGISGSDDWSGKAAAMVSVVHPCSGQRMHVAFTHTQASYDDDDADDARLRVINRAFELRGIEKMIRHVVGDGALENEPVYLAGDLNIDGVPNHPGDPSVDPEIDEWDYHFSSADSYDHETHGFFACGDQPCPTEKSLLTDTWAYHTSPDDLGRSASRNHQTSLADGKRIDYLLRSDAASDVDLQLCSQHLTLAWSVAGDRGTLSDHLPVHGDFNLMAPLCSPRHALTVAPLLQDHGIPGVITFPGSVQWYLLQSAPGSTWSIDVPGSAMDFEVYDPSDLSRPLEPYEGLVSEWGEVFLPDGPVYVKVFGKARATTGAYDLDFHRHDCKSVEDACLLRPATPTAKFFPEDVEQLFFRFFTDSASSGQYPELAFRTTKEPNVEGHYLPQVRLPVSGDPIEADELVYEDVDATTVLGAWSQLDGLGSGRVEFQLTVDRDGPAVGETIVVSYETPLTYVYLDTLLCIDQQDNQAFSDDIWVRSRMDGGVPDSHAGLYSWVGEFDTDSHYPIPSAAETDISGRPLRILSNVDVQLLEEDDLNADEQLLPEGGPILALPPGTASGEHGLERRQTYIEYYEYEPLGVHYHYSLGYRVSHDP